MRLTKKKMSAKKASEAAKAAIQARIKKEGGVKYRIPREPKSFFMECLKKLLYVKTPNFPCPHLRVGASMVRDLMDGKLTFQTCHRTSIKNFSNIQGTCAEAAVQKRLVDPVVQPFGISKRYPFICALGDFIVYEQKKAILIEVKSCRSTIRIPHVINRDTIVQIWTTMDCYQIDCARLYIAYANKDGTLCMITDVVHITKTMCILSQENDEKIITGYINFLREATEIMNVGMTETDRVRGIKMMEEFARRSRVTSDIRTMKPPQRTPHKSCEKYCDITFNRRKSSGGIDDTDSDPDITLLKSKRKMRRFLKTSYKSRDDYTEESPRLRASSEEWKKIAKKQDLSNRLNNLYVPGKPTIDPPRRTSQQKLDFAAQKTTILPFKAREQHVFFDQGMNDVVMKIGDGVPIPIKKLNKAAVDLIHKYDRGLHSGIKQKKITNL
jgi:hypothetical protein